MYIYIYTSVLTDYTDGMAVVIAKNRADADKLLTATVGATPDPDYWSRQTEVQVFKTPGACARVVAYVYGGS